MNEVRGYNEYFEVNNIYSLIFLVITCPSQTIVLLGRGLARPSTGQWIVCQWPGRGLVRQMVGNPADRLG